MRFLACMGHFGTLICAEKAYKRILGFLSYAVFEVENAVKRLVYRVFGGENPLSKVLSSVLCKRKNNFLL